MIKIFEKTIKEHLSNHLTQNDFPFSYLKFSTVTSGSGLNDKVIFLIFKNRAPLPFLCLKTVRNYGAKQAILRNFDNLKKLNAITRESPHARLFAEALCLYDDGENIFSIETACFGEKLSLGRKTLKTVVMEYISFQEYLAKQGNSLTRDMGQLTKETLIKSGLSGSVQDKLLKYIAQFPSADIKLPRIIQHGDLTLDNLLWSKSGLCIIDYDYVGNSDLPGFDLFSLFHRFNRSNLVELCREYFPFYFKKIGGEFRGDDYRGLLLLYRLIEYSQSGSPNCGSASFEEIISDFENLFS